MSFSSSPALRPWLLFLAWVLLCSLVFWKPLDALIQHALKSENASHILIVPFIAAWLLYQDRKKITHTVFEFRAALLLALPGVVCVVLAIFSFPNDKDVLLICLMVCFLLFLVSGFLAIFGRTCAKSEWFPLAFLGFSIPLPEPLLDRFIYLLQAGSADVAEAIFDWSGVPALRDGFIFRLPRLSIEVAKECSGIRSSIALIILALLVAHFSFSKFWKKTVFVIAGLLMMVVKNGVRIATLAILASYVDPGFLSGRLHKEGGFVFFLIGLALLVPVYWFLRRGEQTLVSPSSKASLSVP